MYIYIIKWLTFTLTYLSKLFFPNCTIMNQSRKIRLYEVNKSIQHHYKLLTLLLQSLQSPHYDFLWDIFKYF